MIFAGYPLLQEHHWRMTLEKAGWIVILLPWTRRG